MEALHILLRRLASPNRYIDLAPFFHLRPHYISVVFNGIISLLYELWGGFIRYLDIAHLNLNYVVFINLEVWTILG